MLPSGNYKGSMFKNNIKYLIAVLSAISIQVNAEEVTGPSSGDWKIIQKALKKCQMNYSKESLDELPNAYHDFFRNQYNLSGKKIHNFDVTIGEDQEIFLNNAVVLSGAITLSKGAKVHLNNSVIGNITFYGDVSGIDFSGACVVNTDFTNSNLNTHLPMNTNYTHNLKLNRVTIFTMLAEISKGIKNTVMNYCSLK